MYLDLLPTWREAHDLAAGVRDEALRALTAEADTRGPGPLAVTVHNPVSWTRTDLVRTRVELALLGLADDSTSDDSTSGACASGASPDRADWITVLDDTGRGASVHVEAVADGFAELAFLAEDVPSLGHRTWWLAACRLPVSGGWERAPGNAVQNDFLRAEADPARGGGLARLLDRRTGQELLTPGEVDELVVQEEYDRHPYFEEGPWHLLPKGPGAGSGAAPAESCHVERGPIGSRIVATGRTGPVRWTRTSTLWDGLDRVELTTTVHAFEGSDQLLRLRIPADVPGALPVAETAASAVGRGFAFPEADAGADHTRAPWTLDSPCLNWFALSAPMTGPGGRALGAAEIVLPEAGAPEGLRELVTALGRHGVTATPTRPGGPRWGDLAVDSSLPDFRIALGGPGENPFTAALLESAGPAHEQVLREHGQVWVAARAGLRSLWSPGCDLTGVRDLPVLVLAGPPAELARAVAASGRIDAPAPAAAAGEHGAAYPHGEAYADRTVGILVRGTPSFAVDTAGRLHSTLMRSCTGRPSGAWMDPPRRTAPDGSSFQLQHWTHVFEHALVAGSGDWRAVDLVRRGREFNKPLTAVTAAPSEGPRPPARSLLGVEPADRVLIETVKRAEGSGDRRELAVRLRETHGRPATAETLWPTDPAAEADLLDRPLGFFDGEVQGAATTTLLLLTESGMPLREGEREAHQPVFSRYWLHNTGTAPLGDAPYTVTCDGIPSHVTVTLAAHGEASGGPVGLEVRAPEGWTTSWTRRRPELPAGGHVSFPLTVEPAEGAEPGEHLVRILATTPAGTFEDVLTVTVPGDGGAAGPAGLWVDAPERAVTVAPGARALLRARVGSTGIRTALSGQAYAVSPYGTWPLTAPAVLPVEVPPGGGAEAVFEVRPPLGTPPGEYWVVVKAVCQGRIAYGPAIAVHVSEG